MVTLYTQAYHHSKEWDQIFLIMVNNLLFKLEWKEPKCKTCSERQTVVWNCLGLQNTLRNPGPITFTFNGWFLSCFNYMKGNLMNNLSPARLYLLESCIWFYPGQFCLCNSWFWYLCVLLQMRVNDTIAAADVAQNYLDTTATSFVISVSRTNAVSNTCISIMSCGLAKNQWWKKCIFASSWLAFISVVFVEDGAIINELLSQHKPLQEKWLGNLG